ncbi:hypothetical protein CEQ90_16690 [Lewinellaceae bacterium SD302]|nr:hypothetical protein CEQ90_16690 [Lewinellaceae bacterium SD302]
MENYVFSSRAKGVTGGMMILGLICLIWTYLTGSHEDHHMRFWTNFLHNATFFLGIAFMAGFVLAAFTTAYAGWFVQFKRVWEAYSLWLLPSLFLMGVLIVGLWLHSHHLYHWNDASAVEGDEILTHKSSFLNKYWYTFGTIIFVGAWYFFISKMRSLSVDEDHNGTEAYAQHRSYKKYAAIFLPIAGFTSAALIWQWIMSLDSHWYSTMFAWYATASWFCAMMALTIMMLIYLKSRGYFQSVTAEHFHDLGKYLFAISIFWTYLWFSQYMLIWYGNVGEETIYFRERLDNYQALFYINLVINFLLPFLILMRNDTKRKYGTLFFACVIVLFGHWLDFFMMIKPAALRTVIELEEGHGHGDDHGEQHGANESSDIYHLTSLEVDQHDHDQAGHDNHDGADGDLDHAGDDADAMHNHDGDNHHDGESGDHAGMAGDHGHGDHDGGAHDIEHSADAGGHHAFPERYIESRAGYMLPGFLEIGTFLGFLGGFLFFSLSTLSKAPLEPRNDPYMDESKHHHT